MTARPVRLAHWEDALSTYLDRVRDEPFSWGEHDCALFAAGAVRAMTGTDPAAAFRGGYSDARGAALALRQHGAGTLRKTVVSWFGAPIPPAFAHRGDVVLWRGALGVGMGATALFVGEEPGRAGLISIGRSEIEAAWRVPYEGR